MLTKTDTKISIIIPVYNVEKYLHKCLESLINQSFENIEIICIDDGSTDNSLQILNEYSNKDSRIVVISQQNQGPGAARNKGLEIASGEYIGFVDPDDWVDLDFYENLYTEAKIKNYDIVKGVRVDCKDKDVVAESLKKFKIKNHSKIDFSIFASSWWSCIYKKELIENYSINFPCAYSYEDVAFLYKFLTIAKNYSLMKNVNYYHLIREDSLSPQTTMFSRRLKEFETRLDIFYFINSLNLSKKEYVTAMRVPINSMIVSLDRFVKDNYSDKLEEVMPLVYELLDNLKYKEEFQKEEGYKFLLAGDFSIESFDKRVVKIRFKRLSFIQKFLYFGNVRNYKLISIFGFLFSFKRS